MVLEIHIRLERRFLCLCRRPVGFELVAAVALLDFPRPVLCAALCQFFGFVRPLNAGIVLFNGMYLVVDENPCFLCGAGQRVSFFAAGYRFFLFFKVKSGLCLSCGFVKGALLNQFLFLRDSCICCVQSVSGFV